MRQFISIALILSLSGISYAANLESDQPLSVFDNMAATMTLRKSSCPADTKHVPFSPLKIINKAVKLGDAEAVQAALPQNVNFLGGWHLTARDSDFGGLSGLDIIESGNLLAISDNGTFFEIGMTDGAPNEEGAKSLMLDANGKRLSGKKNTDAEGLAYSDGVAFISFERNHRILAFDVKECGSIARGAWVTKLPTKIDGQPIKDNSGAEALRISSEGQFEAGYETVIKGASPILTLGLREMNDPELMYFPTPLGFKLVGMSGASHLLRAYNPLQGNRNIIVIQDLGVRFSLSPPLAVDNFEGIVELQINDMTRRIYIISDDNFSGRQRSLLYAFDVQASQN